MALLTRESKQRARDQRRTPTEAERKLWSILRAGRLAGFSFRRQHSMPPYIVDFVCLEARLVVEADGGQHVGRDEQRDSFLAERGFRVLRLWNDEILRQPEAVVEVIAARLRASPPPQPSPTLRAGEGARSPSPDHRAGEGRGGGGTANKPPFPRATTITRTGTPTDTITLDHTSRHRRRLRLTTDSGRPFLLDLPEPRHLRDGDLLPLTDGRLVRVTAALEPVADLRCATPRDLTRLAWHLGNRHTPAQVLDGVIRIRPDHVLIDLARRLGAEIVEHDAPFEPETGAYAGGNHHHD